VQPYLLETERAARAASEAASEAAAEAAADAVAASEHRVTELKQHVTAAEDAAVAAVAKTNSTLETNAADAAATATTAALFADVEAYKAETDEAMNLAQEAAESADAAKRENDEMRAHLAGRVAELATVEKTLRESEEVLEEAVGRAEEVRLSLHSRGVSYGLRGTYRLLSNEPCFDAH
jgi:hypothetical protein